MTGRSALVVGATGLVGQALVEALVAAPEYERIVVLARRPNTPPSPKVEWRVVDFEAKDAWSAVAGIEDVYCCLGTTIKQAGSQAAFRKVDHDYPLALAEAARAAGVQRYLVVTAMGADPGSSVFYNRVKGELERALAPLGFPTLVIARPSLLLGHRSEKRAGEGLAQVAMGLVGPLMIGPLKKYRGITGATVAKALLGAALSRRPGNHVILSDELEALGATP